MIPRADIKGFSLRLRGFCLEVVYIKHFWNITTIALDIGYHSKTYYLLDRDTKKYNI